MLTLYHSPKSRSFRIVWLLEELGLPYALKTVPIRRSDGSGEDAGPAYRKIHPHGKVPAIVHDGTTVFETSAIALYLADLKPEAGLAPKVGEPLRGPYLTWLAYSPSVLEPALVCRFMKIDHVPGAMGWAPLEEVASFIDRALSPGPHILGEGFSAADIVLGGGVPYISQLLGPTAQRDAYVERLAARPAYRRAQELDAG